MSSRPLLMIFVLLTSLFLGCGSRSSGATPTGLVVDFKSICKEGEIWLAGTIENPTSKEILISNGVMPWDYDPVGTSFAVISDGQELTRQGGYPPIGRPGPVRLNPAEQRSGDVPIENLFPELRTLSKWPVVVHWVYWTSHVDKNGPGRLEGTVRIAHDPCTR